MADRTLTKALFDLKIILWLDFMSGLLFFYKVESFWQYWIILVLVLA